MTTDKPLTLNWTVKEYIGSEIYKLSDPSNSPIIKLEDLVIGNEIVCWNSWTATVKKYDAWDRKKATATTPDGTLVMLEFGEDDRNCWVASGMINPRALKKLSGSIE